MDKCKRTPSGRPSQECKEFVTYPPSQALTFCRSGTRMIILRPFGWATNSILEQEKNERLESSHESTKHGSRKHGSSRISWEIRCGSCGRSRPCDFCSFLRQHSGR